jgi:hypothetical protein
MVRRNRRLAPGQNLRLGVCVIFVVTAFALFGAFNHPSVRQQIWLTVAMVAGIWLLFAVSQVTARGRKRK